jgi:hypothetical protein
MDLLVLQAPLDCERCMDLRLRRLFMELTQHPLSAAFPAMSAEDFAALEQDIEANGQREPVIVFEDMVLDGWHRYRACSNLGIKPQQFSFAAGKDPVAFVLSQNLHRRHLTASQRAAAVVACSEWQPPNVKKTGRVEPSSTHARTNAEMAKAAQVTPRTITDAKVAHKAGLGDAVKDGVITAKEGAKIARGTPARAPAPVKRAPWDAAPPSTADLSDAREAVSILTDENERLNDRLAVEAMDASEEEKGKAATTISELRAELKTANAELKAVRATRDALMRENGELKGTVARLNRKLKKHEAVA